MAAQNRRNLLLEQRRLYELEATADLCSEDDENDEYGDPEEREETERLLKASQAILSHAFPNIEALFDLIEAKV